MVNQKRLIDNFLKLVAIDSLSFDEKRVARFLVNHLDKLGFKSKIDSAGKKIGGSIGNVIATLNKTSHAPTLLFNAHMDTVSPSKGVKPRITKGVIKSDGKTILGADDKAGLAILLELANILHKNDIPRGKIIYVLTVAEEQGLLGAKNLNIHQIKADYSYSLDSDEPVGRIVVRSPSQNSIKAIFKGKAAHSGLCPEKGIHAIKAATLGISKMKLGRVNKETTANIGIIKGGRAANIIPDEVYIEGEARSFSLAKLEQQTQLMKKYLNAGAQKEKAKVKIEVSRAYNAFNLKADTSLVSVAKQAAKKVGLKSQLIASGGGSDANIFNQKGNPMVGLSIGVENPHSNSEKVAIGDLEKATQMVLEIVKTIGEKTN